jgi:hypothetical protein
MCITYISKNNYKKHLVITNIVLYLSKQKRITMRYQIKRECWNEKTFNGYQDNPYWRIDFQDMGYVLLDDGRVWCTNGIEISDHVLDDIKTIIKECKLNIESLKKR